MEFRLRYEHPGAGDDEKKSTADLKRQSELQIMRNGQRVTRIEINKDRLTVGRSSKRDIVLDEETVSRKHAFIRRLEDGVYLFDANSTCGTFVNCEPILCRRLGANDMIQIGPFLLVYDGQALKKPFQSA